MDVTETFRSAPKTTAMGDVTQIRYHRSRSWQPAVTSWYCRCPFPLLLHHKNQLWTTPKIASNLPSSSLPLRSSFEFSGRGSVPPRIFAAVFPVKFLETELLYLVIFLHYWKVFGLPGSLLLEFSSFYLIIPFDLSARFHLLSILSMNEFVLES